MTSLKSNRGATTLLAATGCFVLLGVAFLARTSGLHVDEGNYMSFALNAPFGDSAETGKPVFFYTLNYLVSHNLGPVLGPLRPLSVHLFYLALFSWSLAWAAASPGMDAESVMVPRLLVLLTSPLAILNSTSLMMESAALAFISIALGCLLRGSTNQIALPLLVISSGLAAAVKTTAIPALLLLVWAFRKRLRAGVYLVPLGMIAGVLVDHVVVRRLERVPELRNLAAYGGLGDLLSPQAPLQRMLPRILPYAAVWVLFAGITFAIIAAFPAVRAVRNREFRVLTLGCGVGLLLTALVSAYPYPRYGYPVIWAGVLGSILAVELRSRVLVVTLVVAQMLLSVPLFTHSVDRFNWWPDLVSRELIDSGGTMFSGFPIFGMTARELTRGRTLCIWVNSANGEKNEAIEGFANSAFPGAAVTRTAAFEDRADGVCSVSNTIRFRREHVESPTAGCPEDCGRCEYQRVDFFSERPGFVRNQICWPR